MENMENSFLEGNGIIILILFFLMMAGWGGAGFGGFNNAAAQGALTRAELADGFNISEIQRNQSDIKEGLCGLNTQIMQNRYDNALGVSSVNQQIMENRYTNSLNTCDLKTAIHAEGEATRAMINQQTIDDLKNQLAQAQNVIANTAQSQTIIGQMQNMMNAMGRWYANPPVNPYTCYNGNGYTGFNGGCGCNNFA